MSSDMLGRNLGSYRILDMIGRGGMTEIYRGHHVELEGNNVTIKIIGRRLERDPLLDERFRRELVKVVQLRHPNIAPVYDFGEEGGGHYVVMDYIEDGSTLADLYKELWSSNRLLDPDDVSFIARQVASALDYAHNQGAIHRNVTPDNIIVRPSGQAFLTDFGLPLLQARGASEGSATAFTSPEYMAPELAIDAGRMGPRSDQYALAVVLYQLTTGGLPYEADTPTELALKHLNENPPAPHELNPALTTAVSRVIMMAMDKEPAARFENAMALADAFAQAWHVPDYDEVIIHRNGAIRRPGEPETPPPPPGEAAADQTAVSEQTQVQTPPSPESKPGRSRSRRRVSPVVLGAVGIAVLVLAGIFIGRAAGFDVGGLLRNTFGGDEQDPGLIVGTSEPSPIPTSTFLPTTEAQALASAGITETPATVEPVEPLPPTPTVEVIPPLEAGTQALRLVDGSLIVYIPAGEFLMGSDDLSRAARERPQHTVSLSAYWIDLTEVTNTQYRQCVEVGECALPSTTRNYDNPAYADFPVVHVTWEDALVYCGYVAGVMGVDTRLPTEAQWEKAASWDPVTGTKFRYPWGDDIPNPTLMRYVESAAALQGAAVGTHPAGASPYGVLDMAGNVWEFVYDWSSDDYYSQPEAAIDPQGPETGTGRIVRGGSWSRNGSFAIATFRNPVLTTTVGEDIGFRCAVNADILKRENSVAFDPQDAIAGAQAAVALAQSASQGDQVILSEWQAALITMNADLDAGAVADVSAEISARLLALDTQEATGEVPSLTAFKLRVFLNWAQQHMAAG